MPFVSVRIVRQVIADDPARKKEEIGREIARAVSRVTGLGEDQVWVVFEEVDEGDWMVGRRTGGARRPAPPTTRV
jgi:4-oxalocrotonate tautomerase